MSRVIIVGGGVMGSSTAFWLSGMPEFKGEVVVVERDPAYRQASSALSASSIRQQFSTPVNIEISKFGIGFLRDAGRWLSVDGEAPELGLREPGYLYLASPAGLPVLEANHAIQRSLDVDVALLDPAALAGRFPWLSTEGVAMGSLGLTGEGSFDGPALLQAFRRKARAQGVTYVEGEVVGLERAGSRVIGVTLADGRTLAADWVVNAAGPWAARIAGMAGFDLPVRARRRCVFVFDCRDPLPGCPLVIDTTGIWFRREGSLFLGGYSPAPEDDPDDLPLEVDHGQFDVLWPALAARVPAFEAIKVTSSWAGYYEFNTFDHNGIVGPHPELRNLVFVNGFSGHGMQQSPAVGRGVAELICFGGYRSLDLGDFRFERLLENRPIVELNVI